MGAQFHQGWQFDDTMRSQFQLTGGGVKTVVKGATWEIKWTTRFIALGFERGGLLSSGYFDINMPADGTVIPGVGGAADVTVTGGRIPLPTWSALWYIAPQPSPATTGTVAANFRVSTYTASLTVPPDWILIAVVNSESHLVKWGTGEQTDYWKFPAYLNGWVTYNTDYPPARYRMVDGGLVEVSGLVKSGTIGASVFQLPVGYRPKNRLLFATASNNAFGRVDVGPDGFVTAMVGNNTWFSIEPVIFTAEQ